MRIRNTAIAPIVLLFVTAACGEEARQPNNPSPAWSNAPASGETIPDDELPPESGDTTDTTTTPEHGEPPTNPCDDNNGGCGDPTYWSCEVGPNNNPICNDINECASALNPCDPLVDCTNSEGAAATCGNCPIGYSGNGYDGCIEKEEVEEENQICVGDYTLSSSEELQTLSTCEVITGTLTIASPTLAAFSLPLLQKIEGSLSIHANELLTDLVGLEKLYYVGMNVKITDNTSLVSLDGLERIGRIPGELYIMDNPNLTNIEGLRFLVNVEGRLLKISENMALQNIHGLESLTSVGGALSIWGNPLITNLDALENLLSIGAGDHNAKNLEINYNTGLVNIDGLQNITQVFGNLQIVGNPILESLAGVTGLTEVGLDYVVMNNTSLPTCESENLIAFLESQNGIGGDTLSSGNNDLGVCE